MKTQSKRTFSNLIKYPMYEIHRDRRVNFAKPKVSDKMTCPFCGEPLIVGDQMEKLESMEEHVSGAQYISDKPVGYCKNPDCKYGRFFKYSLIDGGAYWTKEYFSHFYENHKFKPELDDEYKEIDSYRHAAGNSFCAESAVAIHGEGQLNDIYLTPLLTLGWMRPFIEFSYRANEQGEVTGRSWKLQFLKWDDNSERYCHLYVSNLRMCKFTFREYRNKYKRAIKRYNKDHEEFIGLHDIFRWKKLKRFGYRHAYQIPAMIWMRLRHPLIYLKLRKKFIELENLNK